jgi:hypothetical protein
MSRGSSHRAKTKAERDAYINNLKNSQIDPTTSIDDIGGESTLEDSNGDKANKRPKKTRKSLSNRIKLHFKEHMVGYAVSLLIFIGVYFLITSKVELAQVNKDLSYQSTEITKTSEKVDKISDDVSFFKSEIKSLNDRFQLFIDLCSTQRFERQDAKEK